jgi:uncharacterized protein YggT (Ycf19 family)
MATEVIHESHYHEEPVHHRVLGVFARVLDLMFGLLYSLLMVRFALVLFSARPHTGFYQFIHNATEPFYHPFEGLFATSTIQGFHLEWPLLVAVVVYSLLHAGIRGIMSLATR